MILRRETGTARMANLRALTEAEVTFQLYLEPDVEDADQRAQMKRRVAQGYIEAWCWITVVAGWTLPATGELFTARSSLSGCSISADVQHGRALQSLIEKFARDAGLYEGALTNLNERLRDRVVQAHGIVRALSSAERAHFRPTHRLIVPLSDGTEYVPVMLLPNGSAPGMSEWANDHPAEWQHVGGAWLRNGALVSDVLAETVPPQRRITITLDVETALPPDTIETRVGALVAPEAVRAQMRDGEALEIKTTHIEVG